MIMIRLLILTRSLGNGGAERQLAEMMNAIDTKRFKVTLATFYAGGARWDEISQIPHVRLVCLGKQGRWDIAGFFRSVVKTVRDIRPHVIYSFRDVSNLVSLPLSWLVGCKTVWGIRRSTRILPWHDPMGMIIYAAGAVLSHLTDKIVYNSACGRDLHIRRGYSSHNSVVIPNGFDVMKFKPDYDARRTLRNSWGVEDSEFLIGIVGRFDPVKNHKQFIDAAIETSRRDKRARFVIIGGGSDMQTRRLKERALAGGLEKKVIWAGESKRINEVYNALDLLSLCSREEGSPNVVGEAMACGVPCVVTDVGDAALMVGDARWVVPPGNTTAMIAAWNMMMNMPEKERISMGSDRRERIKKYYGLDGMIRQTESLIMNLMK